MDGEVTAEQARELLDALVEGGGMKHIDTPLALRLIPLADDVGRDNLAAELMERAQAAAKDAVEEGWVSLERLRRHGGDVDEVLALATDMEGQEQGIMPTNRGKRRTRSSAVRFVFARTLVMRKDAPMASRPERPVSAPWSR